MRAPGTIGKWRGYLFSIFEKRKTCQRETNQPWTKKDGELTAALRRYWRDTLGSLPLGQHPLCSKLSELLDEAPAASNVPALTGSTPNLASYALFSHNWHKTFRKFKYKPLLSLNLNKQSV